MTVSPNSTLKKGTIHPLVWIPLKKNGKENQLTMCSPTVQNRGPSGMI